MKKHLAFGLAVAVLGGASAPAAAAYTFDNQSPVCASASLNICVSFQLVSLGNDNWALTTTLDSPTYGGLLKAIGLYSNPDLVPSPTYVSSTPSGWTTGPSVSSSLSSSLFASAIFEVGATQNPGYAGPVTITFYSTTLAAYSGTITARAHVGSIVDADNNCSMKFDSDGTVVGLTAVDGGSCSFPDNTVPEPISMVLLGSGLLGLGAVRSRRKQK